MRKVKVPAWHVPSRKFPCQIASFLRGEGTSVLKRNLVLCTLNGTGHVSILHVPRVSLLLETTVAHETRKVLREEPAGFDFIPAAGDVRASPGPRRLSWASSPLPCLSQAGN